jgi:hypothetical protein
MVQDAKKLICTLDELTDSYGQNLEEIYRREKFQMIESIALYLGQRERGKVRNHILATTAALNMRLDAHEKESLIESIIVQVRNGVWKQ